MANFYMTLSAEEIARQVAILLNDHNLLRKDHTAYTIMKGAGAYFVDVIGGRVIGCSAIHRENAEATRQFHLCVHPDFRRRGIARKLKLAAMGNVTTPYVYVTIREDNVASINLNTGLGFTLVKKDWVIDHHVLTFGRTTVDARPATNTVDLKTAASTISDDNLFYIG
jgi:RimJ/RimL family protein N-acetyltransferase